MKILVFWDIYGRIGRKAVQKEIEALRTLHKPDFIIANVDNLTSGRGPVEKHMREMEKLGIDIFTWWDHVFDNLSNIETYLEKDWSKLLRPLNFFEQNHYDIPGKWYSIIEKNDKKLLVIHIMWQVFMNFHLDSPFLRTEKLLKKLKDEWVAFDASIVDFHVEASAEFYGLAHFLDGEVWAMYGTHTHVQTNDDCILPKGTGILSDVGMNGAIHWVIGADYDSVRKRFVTGISKWLISQNLDPNYVVSWVVFDIDENGKCRSVEKIRINSKL